MWTPTGNGLAFVFQNNIFVRNAAKNPATQQITNSGVPGKIYNGVADWVYEGWFVCSVTCYLLVTSIFSISTSNFNVLCNPAE